MYLIIGILIILFVYSSTRRKNLENQVELFKKLLYREKNPEKYIEEIDKILLRFQSKGERTINYIQKTTGLLYAGRFEEAIEILSENVEKIPPNWQVIYYHNLILCLYFAGHIEKANETAAKAKEILDIYGKKDYNKLTVKLIYAISNFYNENYEECKEFFLDLINITNNEFRTAFGYYFTGEILKAEHREQEAEGYFNKAAEYGKGSFVERIRKE